MFIQTEETPNPDTLKFLPGQTVLESGMVEFRDPESAARSPLAARLFEIDHVARVYLHQEYLTVSKTAAGDWQNIRTSVLGAILEHYTSGAPMLIDSGEAGDADGDGALTAQIEELLAIRIRPAMADDVDVLFRGIEDGVVLLEMHGSPATVAPMRAGIENMMRHYVPDIEGVRFVDGMASVDDNVASGKPGLNSPEAQTIQSLLEEQVNPAIASHGGFITLIDVADDRAYVELGGGCQGCGMVDVTLKQGVEVAIKEAVPSIIEVIDTTDHAGGNNPYYQGSKG